MIHEPGLIPAMYPSNESTACDEEEIDLVDKEGGEDDNENKRTDRRYTRLTPFLVGGLDVDSFNAILQTTFANPKTC